MAALQDCSVGIGVESTFKTGVTPTRWLEYPSDSPPAFDWEKNIVQSQGLRVGSRIPRTQKRAYVTGQGSGSINMDMQSKGMGLLLQNAFGTGVSTLVSGSTFQQNFTASTATTTGPSSLTVQTGLVQAGGTVDAITMLGCMVNEVGFQFRNADIGRIETSLDYADITTATAYTAPSYPASPSLYHFANLKVFTGTLTAPTANTLASATTELLNVREASVTLPNDLVNDRFNAGGGGRKLKQLQGPAVPTGSITVEYDSTTFRDAMLADTDMVLLFQYTAGSLSTGVETLQVVLPAVRLNGPLVQVGDGGLITTQYDFSVLDNSVAAQPIWCILRTADAAL